ncbi:hypothetical protein T439DRAFT_377316 [Meredithblackwellia eburnea MCA 4105]
MTSSLLHTLVNIFSQSPSASDSTKQRPDISLSTSGAPTPHHPRSPARPTPPGPRSPKGLSFARFQFIPRSLPEFKPPRRATGSLGRPLTFRPPKHRIPSLPPILPVDPAEAEFRFYYSDSDEESMDERTRKAQSSMVHKVTVENIIPDLPEGGRAIRLSRVSSSGHLGSSSHWSGAPSLAEIHTGTKREWKELENILFHSPEEFKKMAFDIARTRNTPLLIAADRTSKLISPHMHLTCPHLPVKVKPASGNGQVQPESRPQGLPKTAITSVSQSYSKPEPTQKFRPDKFNLFTLSAPPLPKADREAPPPEVQIAKPRRGRPPKSAKHYVVTVSESESEEEAESPVLGQSRSQSAFLKSGLSTAETKPNGASSNATRVEEKEDSDLVEAPKKRGPGRPPGRKRMMDLERERKEVRRKEEREKHQAEELERERERERNKRKYTTATLALNGGQRKRRKINYEEATSDEDEDVDVDENEDETDSSTSHEEAAMQSEDDGMDFHRENNLPPPYERSLGLVHILRPALSHSKRVDANPAGSHSTTGPFPPCQPLQPQEWSSGKSQLSPPLTDFRPSILGALNGLPRPAMAYPTATAPDPTSQTYQDWQAFLAQLLSPSLKSAAPLRDHTCSDNTSVPGQQHAAPLLRDVFLPLLASPAVGVTLDDFWRESAECREALIGELRELVRWDRVRFAERVRKEGKEVWKAMRG